MRTDRVLKSLIKEKFLVSMVDGTAIEGLLIDADDKIIHLANCEQVVVKENSTNRFKVDGQVFIPRTNILYMQKP